MERFIEQKNIEHYRGMLKTTTDPARRRVTDQLLREEDDKVRKVEEHRKKM